MKENGYLVKRVWLSWFVFVSREGGRLGFGERKMEFEEQIVTACQHLNMLAPE